jgi:hypothetical protein
LIRGTPDEVLEVYLEDNTRARRTLPNGAYTRKKSGDGK